MAKLALRPLDLPPPTLEHDDDAMALEARRAMERRMLRMTPDGPRRDLPLDHAKAALRLALKLCGVWQRGLANGLDICYRTVELGFARLPRAFDGYRILHIRSDPHFDACDGLAEAIVRTVAGAEVDLCVLTGDFRNAERGPSRRPRSWSRSPRSAGAFGQATASWPRSATTTSATWWRRSDGSACPF